VTAIVIYPALFPFVISFYYANSLDFAFVDLCSVDVAFKFTFKKEEYITASVLLA